MSTSLLARRLALRALPRSRGLSNDVNMDAVKRFWEKQAAESEHAGQTSELWRKISYYVCIPAVIVTSIWVYKVETEHMEHFEHLKAENGGKLPPVPNYEYINMRKSGPFPWGNNSLFFNPHTQKNMEEEEE
ncbi:mitochondrial cytochrome c oxidase subunit VIa [Rhodofomes roseus]|uniref:Mitochondrial cytochrome c oxidase subunit VIa n=1 Tax=Rhodofomes roseus TaxID=34475 RepID=A0A4Y9YRS7_9APHY|nr:mitochondrial cytochrome c oxidase subunit VIa [Rhodofomes roseus]KAH9837037.1 mitochondrial cytochrome c oxidase subunit VIa [Rhodofomes roseus]TFY64408.1 hypothetical protein EVJ58_g2634 [Rhodofomes roseus]